MTVSKRYMQWGALAAAICLALSSLGCDGLKANGIAGDQSSSASTGTPTPTPSSSPTATPSPTPTPTASLNVSSTAASITPFSLSAGQTTTITVNITSTQELDNAQVTLYFLYSSGGAQVYTNSIYNAQLTFMPGVAQTVTWSYPVPSSVPAGTYAIEAFVRSSDWNTTYFSNTNLGSLTITASSSSGSPTAPSSGAIVFPRMGVQLNFGTQTYTPASIPALSQYGLILMGGNYPGWPSAQAAAGGPSLATRDAVVQALKGQPKSGKNAVTPIVIQYENGNEMSLTGPWFPEWTTAVTNNNWFVYQSGSSGAKAASLWNSSYVLTDMAHVAGQDTSTGLYPYQLLAKLIYERYYLGTGSAGAAMASTHLDGYMLDNSGPRNLAATAADWLRNGTNPSETDPTATAATGQGKADYADELGTLNANILPCGNNEFGGDLSPTSVGGLGMTSTPMKGKFALSAQQLMFGTTAQTQWTVLNGGSFEAFMTWYQTIDANTRSDGAALMTGGVLTNDYQIVRYSLAATAMRNGFALYGYYTGNSGVEDEVDPGDSSTYPVFDEFWGGSLNLAGYLGAASNTAQGAIQTTAWSQGVWRRDFANGIVLVNPADNGSQNVNLGGTFYHLNGQQAHSINNGLAVSGVTIPAGDGLFLLRTAPP